MLVRVTGLAPPPSAVGGKSPSRSKAADKLLRVLGDAPAHIIDKLNAESKPWYLRADYEEGKDVIIDPDGKVRIPNKHIMMLAKRIGVGSRRDCAGARGTVDGARAYGYELYEDVFDDV